MINEFIFNINCDELWGPVDFCEGILIYSVIRCLRPELVIETGTGYSTMFIADAMNDPSINGEFFSINQDQNQIDKIQNWLSRANLDKFCTLICRDSITALHEIFENHNRVGFAWIDSDHRYKHVISELSLVYEHLKNGGVIMGHDSLLDPRAGRAYRDFTQMHGLSRITIHTDRGVDILS